MSPIQEHLRTTRFRKDADDERRLRELNQLLQPAQETLESGLVAPQYPVVFIIGPPRAGTTLMSQLLASSAALSYVNNFVARFWMAPAVGALIAGTLNIGTRRDDEIPTSSYGVTRGWHEPHEFGYFWSQWFDRGQITHKLSPDLLREIDTTILLRSIASLEAVNDKPLVFKNNTWCTFQAAFLARVFPLSVFVACRRKPEYVAQSLLVGRRERLGSDDLWWSIRPPSYPEMVKRPCWEQIAAQAVDTESTMQTELLEVPSYRVIHAPYREVCARPEDYVGAVCAAVSRMGRRTFSIENRPSPLVHRDSQRIDAEDWRRLAHAVANRQAVTETHGS